MARTKHSVKKKAAALLLVAAMLLSVFGGTWAYRNYKEHKTNELSNTMPKYDVTLIENFQEKDDWKTSDGEITKEIAVKNTGDPADELFQEVYVRIQLKEYMDLLPMVVEETDVRYMINTVGAFIVFDDEQAAKDAYPDHAVDYLTDAISGTSGWFVQSQAHDDNGQYGKYVTTKYELDDKVFVVGDETLENARRDAAKHRKHDATENAECGYPAHLWDGADLSEILAQPGAAEYIKWILGTEVVLYSEWVTNPTYGPFWVIDDRAGQSGWVYWGEALFPGDTTANFLEAVELIQQPNGDFYYAIHTEMQAVSIDELFGTDPQWPDAPPEWKTIIQENAPQVIIYETGDQQVDVANLSYTIKQGESISFNGIVKPDTADQTIEWTVSGGDRSAISLTVNSPATVTGLKPGTATIKATSVELGKSTNINITVSNEMTLWFELQQLIEEAQSLDPADYTPESWTISEIEDALANGLERVETDTDDQLQTAIDWLKDALAAVEPIGNARDNLNDLLDTAKEFIDYDDRDLGDDHSGAGTGALNPYTPDYLDEIQNLIDEAEGLLADEPPASDEELEEIYDQIKDLLDNPVYKADTSAYDALILQANGLEEDDYTTSSWAPFADALADANAAYNNPNSTAQELSDAFAALEEKMAELVLRGNAGDLNTLIQNAVTEENKGQPGNFTVDSFDALEDALDATGRTTPVDTSDMSQDEVDALIAILQPAYEGLVDISGLAASVATANGLTPADYSNWTEKIVTPGVLADAIATLANDAATQAEVDAAKAALDAALAELTVAGKLSDLQAAAAAAKNAEDYTSASWAASGYGTALDTINNMITNMTADPNAYTPAEIATAIAALNTAETGLVLRADPTALIAARANAKTGLNQADYTTASWAALESAVVAGGVIANADKPWPDRSAAEQQTLIDGITAAKAGLIDISALTAAITAAVAKIAPEATASSAVWNNAGAFNSALSTARAATTATTQAAVDSAAAALVTATTNLVRKPVVTGITVAASDAITHAASAINYTLNLMKSDSARTITLTAAVSGTNLSSPNTTWTKTGANVSWGAAPASAATYDVTIPAGESGSITVTATAKDDSTKKVIVTIQVTEYTLRYSEGNMLFGATAETNTTTAATATTINLTSPVGAETTRYFTTRNAADSANFTVDADNWVLDTTGLTNGSATRVQVSSNNCYGVTFAVGTTGTVTLTVGSYVITFHLTADRAQSFAVQVGETFIASGIEWRVLYKEAGDALIIAEHILDAQDMNSVRSSWPTAIRWDGSDLRAELNGSAYSYSYENLDPTFKATIQNTTLSTIYGTGLYYACTDHLFFLSEEEVYGEASATYDLEENLYGKESFFADNNARKATSVEETSTSYWLRSPGSGTICPDVVNMSSGVLDRAVANTLQGVRPSCVITLEP